MSYAEDRGISEWRSVVGWPNYEVSEFGEVRRAIAIRISPKHSIVKPFLRCGYTAVSLCFGGGSAKAKKFNVHRLVAEAFLGPCPSPKHIVAHYDGKRTNAHYSNLRWATYAENEADKKKHGTNPKLTWADVTDIRTKFLRTPIRELGRMYDVDPSYLSKVKRGMFWK